MKFADVATQVLTGRIASIEQRLCPDQYVGQIYEFNVDQVDFLIRQPTENRPAGVKCIIMIIESPHLQEFVGEPAPAKGNTGKLIRKWLSTVVGVQYQKYGLLLVNAIQHQCSLGVPTKCFRDEVFKAVWDSDGKKKFISRLKAIYRTGDVVMNCCTKGNAGILELRQMVNLGIREANVDGDPLRRTHPSAWYSKKNREHIWSAQS